MPGDPEHIRAWQRLDDRITTSGQPNATDFADLKALGVRTVVNLAPVDAPGAMADEGATVARLGMDYIHIPVVFSNPTEADFEQFCATIDALSDQTIHVHCIINARVSAFFCRYRRDRLGWSDADARAEMLKIWDPDTYGDHGKAWPPFLEKSKT